MAISFGRSLMLIQKTLAGAKSIPFDAKLWSPAWRAPLAPAYALFVRRDMPLTRDGNHVLDLYDHQ
ncbi:MULTISPECIES: hypothetical protein [unclassified Mesorhizobium]|uniref:hypothetical protein n=1 Tax=unclassified Mesorhizobium TaxID=325217 RepID=UPI001CCED79E|nr:MULTISPECIES: hypothetical protein [unclassified Mesorhizobium]MBZ9738812.1 hypothetical protein [Mesorhizobium sp. CO1-1-4]MBZ9802886.1 hypothetical protein [Mesorhizobium sp. ES1-6]